MSAVAFLAVIVAAASLGLAAVLAAEVRRAPPGGTAQVELMTTIRTGALVFLRREQAWIAVFVLVVSGILGVVLDEARPWASLAYLAGALASGSAGVVGIRIATLANARTALAARRGIGPPLVLALRGGAVMGLVVAASSLGGFALAYLCLVRWLEVAGAYQALAAYGFGASSVALFGRVAGGIFTKAADVGADMVGKVDLGIPEDDPRNPAVVADNVGDNVGDVAGMGADLFESHVGSLIAPVVLAALIFTDPLQERAAIFPIAVATAGLAASALLVAVFGRGRWRPRDARALQTTMTAAAGVTMAATVPLAWAVFADVTTGGRWWGVVGAVVAGVVAGVAIGGVSQVFTSARHRPVRTIAEQSEEGAATTVLSGISAGMVSVAYAAVAVVGAVVASHWLLEWALPGEDLAGLYGIALAATGMLSTAAVVVAVDAYGPIADNAGGIAVMTAMEPEVRETTDALDAVGNTTAAMAKGFAVGSAALTALALFGAFAETAGIDIVIHPGGVATFAGIILGAAIPFLFGALTIDAVGRAAGEMTEEVRRQFREIPGLLEGRPGAVADHTRCVSISTDAALRSMVAPGLLAVVVPIAVGMVSREALAGLLAGAIATGFGLAVFMTNAGAAWDNAKKHIEAGAHGGIGSEAHRAAVTGDTVGDPFKDTAGPAMNILIKVMSIVALVAVPFLG